MNILTLSTLCLIVGLSGTPESPSASGTAQQSNDFSDNACITCHTNLPGRLSGVVQEWKQSVHYAHQVTCDGCHGGDPTIKREQCNSDEDFKERSHLRRDSEFFNILPSSGFFTSAVRGRSVSYFCGKCHAQIKEKHLGSPHGDMGNPTCLYCHGKGSHAIQPPTLDIIDPRSKSEGGQCAVCHRAATMEAVATIKAMLSKTQKNLETADEQEKWLTAQGYKNLALQKLSGQSKESLSRLRQTFHSFNQRDISSLTSAIDDNTDLIQQTYDMIVDLEKAQKRQALIGGSATAFLLLFVALLLYYRKVCLH